MHEYNDELLKQRKEMIDKIKKELEEANHFIKTHELMIEGLEEANKEIESVLLKRS